MDLLDCLDDEFVPAARRPRPVLLDLHALEVFVVETMPDAVARTAALCSERAQVGDGRDTRPRVL
jgi:hypothetical protein